MFFKNILKFTSILTILFLITCLLFSIIKPIGKEIIDFIDSTKFIILFILICTILYILCKYTDNLDKINTIKKNKLFDDETDKEFNADKVVGLKNIINSHEGNRFFSLALIGDWGSGKSSFLRKLEDIINSEKKDIVIYLNVWELENIQNILQEIEKEFDNIIFKHNKTEWSIYHLKSILIKNYFSLLSKYFVENSININLPFSNTIKDSKDEYNKLLKRVLQDKKIVLILDELDRLESKADVLDIFKIIRYLASFDKVFTITGLDINKLNGIGIELDYTHKIFNSKYVIPKTTRSELLTFLREKGIEKLSDFFKEENKEKHKEEFINFINSTISNDKCLIDIITTYREIKNIINDTIVFCNSLKNNLHNQEDWDKFIDLKFIFILNTIKSVNFKFYVEFMKEEDSTKILILNYGKRKSKQQQNLAVPLKEAENEIIKKFSEYKNIFDIISNIFSDKFINLEQQLYIYTHQNIYNYMFTEKEYQDFLNDKNSIKDKDKNSIKAKFILLNNNSKNKYFEKKQFIIFLIARLYEEENQDNRKILIKKVFENRSEINLISILTEFLKVDYPLYITKELFDFLLENLNPEEENYFNNSIKEIIEIDSTGDFFKKIYTFSKSKHQKQHLKDRFLDIKKFELENKEKLFKSITTIYNYFGEEYKTFFGKEIEYKVHNYNQSNYDEYLKGSFIIDIIEKHIKETPEFENNINIYKG